jgi:hypothetical protein
MSEEEKGPPSIDNIEQQKKEMTTASTDEPNVSSEIIKKNRTTTN